MAVTDRQAKLDVMARVFGEILDLEDDSDLHKACVFDQVTSIEDLLAFCPAEIEDLTYLVNKVKTKISKGSRGKVFALQAILLKREGDLNVIHLDWSNVNRAEFDAFRTSAAYVSARAGLPNPVAPRPAATVVPAIIRPRDPLNEYRRNIRRDPNAFTALKEDKQWDSWQRSTIAQARAQDMSDILDESFIPSTPEAMELFIEKQKFFYAVFEKNLLTDKGKALVRHYGPTFDAQRVYKDLSAYAKSSTMASMEASNLLTYITSAKLGDGTWKGKAHGFVLHWQDKIRQYELLLPPVDHFPTSIKRSMLENAGKSLSSEPSNSKQHSIKPRMAVLISLMSSTAHSWHRQRRNTMVLCFVTSSLLHLQPVVLFT
jgi:hypothetical protein